MMELILDGDAKEKQSWRQGNYTLGEGLVNGFPYWYHQDGNWAIWSVWFAVWMVGDKRDIGNPIGGIAVVFDSKVWPTQILDGFLYYTTGSWYSASLNEVLFKDCKHKFYMEEPVCSYLNHDLSSNFIKLKVTTVIVETCFSV